MRSPKVPWWPGSVVSESGVHVHHLVFGIVTMMIAGTRRLQRARRESLAGDLRLRLRRRRRPDDRRVRALGLPRRRLLGRGGAQLDRRDRDRRRGDGPDPARLQPVQLRHRLPRRDRSAASSARAFVFALVAICFVKQRLMHGCGRLLRPSRRDLRRLPARQAGLALGAPALRRARPRQADEGRGALPARPAHRALQERLPRHRRRQAERGRRRGPAGGDRRHPRGGGRSAPPGRTGGAHRPVRLGPALTRPAPACGKPPTRCAALPRCPAGPRLEP